MIRRAWVVAVGVLALAGCASDSGPIDASKPTAPSDGPVSTPAPTPAKSPRPSGDMCGASRAQSLVGRPRSAIPIPVQPGLQRVACATCPVTADYNPLRLNFFYDPETGVVTEVKCG